MKKKFYLVTSFVGPLTHCFNIHLLFFFMFIISDSFQKCKPFLSFSLTFLQKSPYNRANPIQRRNPHVHNQRPARRR